MGMLFQKYESEFAKNLPWHGNGASFKCYLLWRVVNRTRQLLLKFSLLSSINSPRGREEEREETTDEIDMRSILF